MRPGQVSRPIPVTDGVWILSLRDKRAGAGAELVSLKQVALRVPQSASETDVQAATAKLETLRPTITGCADMEAKAASVQGAVAGDLGEASVEDLSPAFRQAAQTLQQNQVSAPIRTNVGVHLIAVCGKRQSGGGASSTPLRIASYASIRSPTATVCAAAASGASTASRIAASMRLSEKESSSRSKPACARSKQRPSSS